MKNKRLWLATIGVATCMCLCWAVTALIADGPGAVTQNGTAPNTGAEPVAMMRAPTPDVQPAQTGPQRIPPAMLSAKKSTGMVGKAGLSVVPATLLPPGELGDDNGGGDEGGPRAVTLVYDNIQATPLYYAGLNGGTYADDCTLDPAQPTYRCLDNYVVEMYATSATAPYTLVTQLYTAVGSAGNWDVGDPIAGTQATFTNIGTGTQSRTAGPFAPDIAIPSTVWVVYTVTMTTGSVGPTLGEEAELGSTDDYFARYISGVWGYYDFTDPTIWSGFKIKINCDAGTCNINGACCWWDGDSMECTPNMAQGACEDYPQCGTWYMGQTCPPTGGCPEHCVVTCTKNENEPDCYTDYVDVSNGGCNSVPPEFDPIAFGETICGTSGVYQFGAEDLYRDTDWYVLTITNPGYTNINWTVRAEFPVRIFVLADGTAGSCVEGEADYYGFLRDGDPCTDVTIDWCVVPGTYWLVVMPKDWNLCYACGEKYLATVTCTPACTPEMTEDELPSEADIIVELIGGSNPGIYTIPFSTKYDYDGEPCALGTTVIERYDMPYQTGLDIAANLATLNMTGLSGLGDIKLNLAATPSTGMVQNVTANAAQDNIIAGDSFFDVWFEIDVPGYGLLHNVTAVRVAAEITTLPPVGAHYAWAPTSVIKGDLNNNGVVNGKDIQCFVNCALGFTAGCNCIAGDFNGNGIVDVGDINIVGPSNDFIECLLATGCGSSGTPPIELRDALNVLKGYLRGVDHVLWADGAYCPPDATFSQAPNDAWTTISDDGFPYAAFDNYWVAAGQICDLHWWGMNMVYPGWTPCNKPNEQFRIEVYNNIVVDGVKQPGTERLCGPYIVTPSKRDTCDDFNDSPIWLYETVFDPCCELDDLEVWILIQGIDGGGTCYYCFMTSLDGDTHMWLNGGVWAHDMAMCVTGTQEDLIGACCDISVSPGVCTDNVNAENCLGANQQFSADTLCADLNPPCGGGACCTPLGECVLVLSQAICEAEPYVGTYYAGMPCPDPEYPEIPDPCHGSCCVDTDANSVIDTCLEGLTYHECLATPGQMGWNQSQTCAACKVACCYYGPTQCLDQYEQACTGDPGLQGVPCADTGCNKDCATAKVIPSLPYTDTGGNAGTGDEYQFICGGAADSVGPDVVYKYVCTSAIDVSISLCAPDPGPYTDYDTTLYVYEDNCGTTTDIIACNEDDACARPNSPMASAIDCVHFLAGHTYYIIVDGYDATSIGHYYIHVAQTTFTAAAAADTCPAGSLFDQHLTVDFSTAVVSDTGFTGGAVLLYDNFWRSNSTTFTDMTFWGVTAYNDGTNWTSCTENPMTFQIKFYQDNGGKPGTALYTYSNVILTGVDTLLDFGDGWPIYEYTATAINVAGLQNGWVSVQGGSAPATCWFMWVDTFTNCGPLAFEGVTGPQPIIYDFSFCLSP